MNKQALRLKYKSKRAHITEKQRDEFSINIANNCLSLPIWEFSNYHIFLPIVKKLEVNTVIALISLNLLVGLSMAFRSQSFLQQ